eukprot:2089145-Rhodomonas_salina.2
MGAMSPTHHRMTSGLHHQQSGRGGCTGAVAPMSAGEDDLLHLRLPSSRKRCQALLVGSLWPRRSRHGARNLPDEAALRVQRQKRLDSWNKLFRRRRGSCTWSWCADDNNMLNNAGAAQARVRPSCARFAVSQCAVSAVPRVMHKLARIWPSRLRLRLQMRR